MPYKKSFSTFYISLCFVLFFCLQAFSQNVGIGTKTPDAAAKLDVSARDMGILIPSVALKNNTDDTTITAGNIEGLLVFNTGTSMGLRVGFYYWSVDKWNALAVSTDNLKITLTKGLVTKEKLNDNVLGAGLKRDGTNAITINVGGAFVISSGKLRLKLNPKLLSITLGELSVINKAITEKEIASESLSSAILKNEAVTTAKIKNEAVTTDKLKNESVTSAKIPDGIIIADKIKKESVTDADFAVGVITNEKIATLSDDIKDSRKKLVVEHDPTTTKNQVIWGLFTGNEVLAGQGLSYDAKTDSLHINVDGRTLAIEADVLKIKDEGITSDYLAKDAIDRIKIKDGAVTSAKIKNEAITTAKIKDGSIIAANLKKDAVTADKIKDGSVMGNNLDPALIGRGLVQNTRTKAIDLNVVAPIAIKNDTLVVNLKGLSLSINAKGLTLKNKGIVTVKIKDAAVDSLAIKDGSITTAKIKNNTIDTKNIADDAIISSKIKDGEITSTHFPDNEIDIKKIKLPGNGSPDEADKVLLIERNIAGTKNKLVWQHLKQNKNIGKGLHENLRTHKVDIYTDGTTTEVDSSTDVVRLKAGGITTNEIADEAIENKAVKNGVITLEKIALPSHTKNDLGKTIYIKKNAVTGKNELVWGIPSNAGALQGDGLSENPDKELNVNVAKSSFEFVRDTITIKKDAVTTDHIKRNTLQSDNFASGSVATDNIKDQNVTPEKISARVAGDGISQNTVDKSLQINVKNGLEIVQDALLVAYDKTYFDVDAPSGALKIKDKAIKEDYFVTDAVETDQLKNIDLVEDNFANGAIGKSLQIKDDAVTGVKIANGTITAQDMQPHNTASANVADDIGKVLKLKRNTANTANEVVFETPLATDINVSELDGEGLAYNSVSKKIDVSVDDVTVEIVNDTLRLKNEAVTTRKIEDKAVQNKQIKDAAVTIAKLNVSNAGGDIGKSLVIKRKTADDGNEIVWQIPDPAERLQGEGMIYNPLTKGIDLNVDTDKFAIVSDKLTLKNEAIDWRQIKDGGIDGSSVVDKTISPVKIEPLSQKASDAGKIIMVKRNGLGQNKVVWASISDVANMAGKALKYESTKLHLKADDNTLNILQDTLRVKKAGLTKDYIVNDAVTTDKIEDGTITTDKIEDGAVTAEKINANLYGAGLSQNASTKAMQVNVKGGLKLDAAGVGIKIDGTTLALSSAGVKVATDGITAVELATDAVITTKVKDSAVVANKIKDDAVTTAKIQDGAVTAEKINVVFGGKNTGLTIKNKTLQVLPKAPLKLDSNALTLTTNSEFSVSNAGLKIADGAVTVAKIKDDAVITDKIKDGAVTAEKIADGAVITSKIKNGTITADKLAPSIAGGGIAQKTTLRVTSYNVNAGKGLQIINDTLQVKLDGNTLVNDANGRGLRIGDKVITALQIAPDAVTEVKIKDSAVVALKIAPSAVTTAKIKDGAVTTAKIKDGAVTAAKIAPAGNTLNDTDKYLKVVATGTPSVRKLTWQKISQDASFMNSANGKGIALNAVTKRFDVKVDDKTIAIKDDTLTLKSNSITKDYFANNAVTTAKIKDGSVTTAKILKPISPADAGKVLLIKHDPVTAKNEVVWDNFSYAYALEGNGLSKNPTADKLRLNYDNSIFQIVNDTLQLKDNSIKKDYFTANAVTTDKIKSGSITIEKISVPSHYKKDLEKTMMIQRTSGSTSVSEVKWETVLGASTRGADGSGLLENTTNNRLDVNADETTLTVQNDTLQVKSGGIGTTQLNVDAVNTQNIADGAVTSAKIKDGELTMLQFDNSMAGDYLRKNASDNSLELKTGMGLEVTNDTLRLKLDGASLKKTTAGLQVADGQITKTFIKNDAVTTDKIKNANVISNKIAKNAVVEDKIENGAITVDKIKNGTILAEDLSPNLAGKALVKNNSTDAFDVNPSTKGLHIHNDAITLKLEGNSLTTSSNGVKITDNTVTTNALADEAVELNAIENRAVKADEIALITLEDIHFRSDAITPAKIRSANLPGDGLSLNAATKAIDLNVKLPLSIVDDTVRLVLDGPSLKFDSSSILEINKINTIQIKDDDITSDRINEKAITPIKIANNAIGTKSFAKNSILPEKMSPLFYGKGLARNTNTNAFDLNLKDELVISISNKAVLRINTLSPLEASSTGLKIGAGKVNKLHIKDGAVTTIKVKDGAVTKRKLEINRVASTTTIADGAVIASKIPSGSLTLEKFVVAGDNVLDRGKGFLVKQKLGGGNELGWENVATPSSLPGIALQHNIINDRIDVKVNEKSVYIVSDTLRVRKIKTEHLVDDAITSDKFADNSVGKLQIKDNSVISLNIAKNAIKTRIIDKESLINKKIKDSTLVGENFNTSIVGYGIKRTSIGALELNVSNSYFFDAKNQLAIKLNGGSLDVSKEGFGVAINGIANRHISLLDIPVSKLDIKKQNKVSDRGQLLMILKDPADPSKNIVSWDSMGADKFDADGKGLLANTNTGKLDVIIDKNNRGLKIKNDTILLVLDNNTLGLGRSNQLVVKDYSLTGNKIKNEAISLEKNLASGAVGRVLGISDKGKVFWAEIISGGIGVTVTKNAKPITSNNLELSASAASAALNTVSIDLADDVLSSEDFKLEAVTAKKIASTFTANGVTNEPVTKKIILDVGAGLAFDSNDKLTLRTDPDLFEMAGLGSDKLQLKKDVIEHEHLALATMSLRKFDNSKMFTSSDKHKALTITERADGANTSAFKDLKFNAEFIAGDGISYNKITKKLDVNISDKFKFTGTESRRITVKNKPKDASDPSTTYSVDIKSTGLSIGTITSQMLSDDAIINDKIAPKQIDSDIIREGTISTDKIKDGAIRNFLIKDRNITAAKIHPDSITTSKIRKDAVVHTKIDDNAVTNIQLANEAITNSKIKDGVLTLSKLFANQDPAANNNALMVTRNATDDGNILKWQKGTDYSNLPLGDLNYPLVYAKNDLLHQGKKLKFRKVGVRSHITDKSGSLQEGKISGGEDVIAIGYKTAESNSSGHRLVLIGTEAGVLNTSGDDNVFIGHQAGRNNSTGGKNVMLGYKAGFQSGSSGSENVFLGTFAGQRNQGLRNTYIGYDAGDSGVNANDNFFAGYGVGNNNTTGDRNVFIGNSAGAANKTGSYNIMIGSEAGKEANEGINRSIFIGIKTGLKTIKSDNVFIGDVAGNKNTAGWDNVFVGTTAGRNNEKGKGNVYLGHQAGYKTQHENLNVNVGAYAGFDRKSASITVSYEGESINIGYEAGKTNDKIGNIFVGHQAGKDDANGKNLIIIGHQAAINTSGTPDRVIAIGTNVLKYNPMGEDNIIIGRDIISKSLSSRRATNRNIIIGNLAFSTNAFSSSNDVHDNVIIGDQAAKQFNDGEHMVVVGSAAMANSSTALNRAVNSVSIGFATSQKSTLQNAVVIGSEALRNGPRMAGGHVLIGYKTGYNLSTRTATDANVFVGSEAGSKATTVKSSVFIGAQAGKNVTTGQNNTLIGSGAGNTITTGEHNIAVGKNALKDLTTKNRNIAIGEQAGYSNTTGNDNIFIGLQTGYAASIGDNNVFIGYKAGSGTNSGVDNDNVFIGYRAGSDIPSSSEVTRTTLIGYEAGKGMWTCQDCVLLGAGATGPRDAGQSLRFINIGNMIYGANTSNGYGFTIDNGSTTPTTPFGNILNVNGDIGVGSNIVHSSDIRLKKDIHTIKNVWSRLKKMRPVSFFWKNPKERSVQETIQYGFIAQEAQKLFPHLVKKHDHSEYFYMGYKYINPLMVEALKELEATYQKEMVALKKTAKDQKAQGEDQDKRLARLQKMFQ